MYIQVQKFYILCIKLNVDIELHTRITNYNFNSFIVMVDVL